MMHPHYFSIPLVPSSEVQKMSGIYTLKRDGCTSGNGRGGSDATEMLCYLRCNFDQFTGVNVKCLALGLPIVSGVYNP